MRAVLLVLLAIALLAPHAAAAPPSCDAKGACRGSVEAQGIRTNFTCTLDGAGCDGRVFVDGNGEQRAAGGNVTWQVDASPPTAALAWNGTVMAGDLDGDGAPDLVVSDGCDATGSQRPCGPDGQANATARHNGTGFFDITYRARNGTLLLEADLDGDGLADLVVSGEGSGPQGVPRNLTVQGVLRDHGLAAFVDCRDNATSCSLSASGPGAALLAFTSPRGEGAFVFAGGTAHGCFVDAAAPTSPKCF